MIESEAQINFLFLMDGKDITFNNFTVKALLGFHITDVYEDGTQEQVFKFILKDTDISSNSISLGDEFTYVCGSTEYTFTVQLFTPDMTGCTLMTAAYEGRT